MRKAYIISVLAASFIAGAFAQSDADYQGWMKSNGATMREMQKAIMDKDGGAAEAGAKKLESNFKMIHAYWEGKHVSDATELAMKGETAAGEVAAAAAAGDFDKAAASLKMVQGSCGACHMAHREKAADGSFKMK